MKKNIYKIYWKYIGDQFSLFNIKNLTYIGQEECVVVDKYAFENYSNGSTSNYGYVLKLKSKETGYMGLYKVNSKTYYKLKRGKLFKEMAIIKSQNRDIIAFSNNKDEIEAKKEVQKEAIKIVIQVLILFLVGISVLYWILTDFILNIKLF